MIKEAVQEISKSTLTVIIVLGVLMFIVGAADSIVVGSFSLHMLAIWKTAIGIIGFGFICFGIYLVWRESGPAKSVKSTKVSSISHPLRSIKGEHEALLIFANASNRTIEIFWINYEGTEKSFGQIPPGGKIHKRPTFATHPFLIKDASTGEQLFVVQPRNENDLTVQITVEDAVN
jgi:vacuolar-type H+-ATPase subunit I/STV1